jgi:hypothetical protein
VAGSIVGVVEVVLVGLRDVGLVCGFGCLAGLDFAVFAETWRMNWEVVDGVARTADSGLNVAMAGDRRRRALRSKR